MVSRGLCNKLHHPAISPEQGDCKNVSTDGEVLSKIKVACFFLGHGVYAGCNCDQSQLFLCAAQLTASYENVGVIVVSVVAVSCSRP